MQSLLLLYLIALYFYLDGFFLTKHEISSINTFSFNISQTLSTTEKNSNQSIQRIFFFIIDALRYDFIVPNDPKLQNQSKFSIIHDLIHNNSSQCLLASFRADPPTTTSQRLRGIMTGSLPTFIEIGSNFHSNEVNEDSLIKQWKIAKKRLVMLGDDTWEALFPQQFDISFPFDSFNTRDIDTVDYGILNNLWNTFHNDKWDVLIAHFLGVDHIGHTYHAYHPLMNDRLELMNNILTKVIESLPNDTLLILMGDHGMTVEGEHGKCDDLLSSNHLYS